MLLKGWSIYELDQDTHGLVYPVLNSSFPLQDQPQTSMFHQQQDTPFHAMTNTPGKQMCSLQGNTSSFGNNSMLPADVSGCTDGLMMALGKLANEQQMPLTNIQTMDQQMMVPVNQTAAQKTMSLVSQNAEQQKREDQLRQQLHKDCMDTEVEIANDDIMGSFMSNNSENADFTGPASSNMHPCSSAFSIDEVDGLSFKEVGSINPSKGKLLCCHFSSNGKLLATAGHEVKVLLWNVFSSAHIHTAEEHSQLITDVRFKPNSSIFATSSFDRTLKIWDPNQPNKSLKTLHGHVEQVTSLDFNPRKTDILCSCDIGNEIRLWSVGQSSCMGILKGGKGQVRFQPRIGNLLAAASGNRINIFDVETNTLIYYLEGHVGDVCSICWDTSGRYLASVSEESARIWSVVMDGRCIYALQSSGDKFESCTFHPGYSQLLVIGSCQKLDLWNPTDNKTLTINAHEGIISALTDCPRTEMIASVSHDQCVKLWR